jgi:hypothetical protein
VNKKLTTFIQAVNDQKGVEPFSGRILALDPGETTGFAVFDADPNNIDWLEIDQVKTWPEDQATSNIWELFNRFQPKKLAAESYRVYDWKSDDHKWSSVNTVQIIGCIWTLAQTAPFHHLWQNGIVWQSAQNAKGFWTDDKLREFGVYLPGVKHGRDATRHALHFLCFGAPK